MALSARIVVVLLSTFVLSTSAAPHRQILYVYFPHIKLLPDEQIESFRLSVPCGHIQSLANIPNDWNIEIVRAISSTEELRASAGHGISYIREMALFNGVIAIEVQATSCFKPSAEITAVFDDARKIKIESNALRLLPKRHAAQPISSADMSSTRR